MRIHPILFVTLTGVALTAPSLEAQTTSVWSGNGTDNKWSTTANWDVGASIANGNILQFGISDTNIAWNRQTNVNDLSNFSGTSLILNNGGWNLSGNAITLSGNATGTVIQQNRTYNGNQTTIGMDITFSGTGNRTIQEASTSSVNHVLELSGKLSGDVGLRYQTAVSSNKLILRNTANDFTGNFTFALTGSTVVVTALADKGVASSLGKGSMIAFQGGQTQNGRLSYIGTANASTNRDISMTNLRENNITFSNDSANNSNLSFTGSMTAFTLYNASSKPTLHFEGSSTGNSTFAAIISNAGQSNDNVSIAVDTAGKWTLTGDNSYNGTTTVTRGTLIIQGAQTGLGTVTVNGTNGAALGGNGSVAGSLSLEDGAKFVFSLTETFKVNGASVAFGGFAISDLVGFDNSVANGDYALILGSATFNYTNLDNYGEVNAIALGGGRIAYFDDGASAGLTLKVIPEPATWALIGLAGILAARRRRY